MAIQSGSALWESRYRVTDLIDLPSTDDLSWDRLNLRVRQQEQDNWCWAATSDGISHYYNPSSTWTQCTIANADLGRTDCCGKGGDGPCNVYGCLRQALTTVGHFDRMAAQVADFPSVDDQIDAKRPMGVRIAWSGGGAHFVAIGGYRKLPEQYVHIEDPWLGPSDLAYSTLKSGYQGIGTWTHSYWTKA